MPLWSPARLPILAALEEIHALKTSHRDVFWETRQRVSWASSNPPSPYMQKRKSNYQMVVAFSWWERVDSNHRSETQQIYSLPPLATRELSPMSSCEEVCENCTLQANGAGERTRTPDLLITNQLLYQLSYTSAFARRPAQFPQLRPAQCRRWNQAACLLYRGPLGKSSGNSKKTRIFSLLCREERIREKTVDFFRFRATMGVWRNPPKKE